MQSVEPARVTSASTASGLLRIICSVALLDNTVRLEYKIERSLRYDRGSAC